MNTYIGKFPPLLVIILSITFAIEMIDAVENFSQNTYLSNSYNYSLILVP
jgi:hypothetical protein